MLKDNLTNVEQHIKEACERSGRSLSEVCLVAVSKTKPKEMLMEVYDCVSGSLERIMFRKWWTRWSLFLRI